MTQWPARTGTAVREFIKGGKQKLVSVTALDVPNALHAALLNGRDRSLSGDTGCSHDDAASAASMLALKMPFYVCRP